MCYLDRLGVHLLAAAERADDDVVDGADVGDVGRPRRRGAGRGPGRQDGAVVVRVPLVW